MDGKKEKEFVSVGDASIITGLDGQTIRKLFGEAQISGFKTPSGQRRISRKSLQEMLDNNVSNENKQTSERKNFPYARVSTKKQMDDLSRQIEYLKRPEYSGYTLIQDIGSGINFKRKGLSSILDSCIQGVVGKVVVAHRDRLSRFGFELIELIVKKGGGKITVLDNNGNKSSHAELSEDLMSIIHVFNCREMGKRSYKTGKTKDIKSKAIPDNSPETTP